MTADIDQRHRPHYCVPRFRDELDDIALHVPRFISQVVLMQQAVVISIALVHELVIDVRERYRFNLDPGIAEDPVLYRAIQYVVVLHGRRRLHFNDTPTVRLRDHDVGAY